MQTNIIGNDTMKATELSEIFMTSERLHLLFMGSATLADKDGSTFRQAFLTPLGLLQNLHRPPIRLFKLYHGDIEGRQTWYLQEIFHVTFLIFSLTPVLTNLDPQESGLTGYHRHCIRH